MIYWDSDIESSQGDISVCVTEPCPDIKPEGGVYHCGGVPAWGIVLMVLLVLLGAAFGFLLVLHVRLRRELQQLRQEAENRHNLLPVNGNSHHDRGGEQD